MPQMQKPILESEKTKKDQALIKPLNDSATHTIQSGQGQVAQPDLQE